MNTVVLLRHGETEWNRTGRSQGWAPVSLNDRGREQARAAGEHLATAYDVDRIVASDLERTRETTDLVADHVDAPVTHDAAWRERHLGVFQGLLGEDLFERFPEFALSEYGREAAERAPEGGESFVEMRERVVDAWEALAAGVDEETVLVVSHGGTIKLLLGSLKGLAVETSVLEQSQSNCGVSEIELPDRIVRENETPY